MMRMAITITTFTVVQMIPTKKLQASIIVTVLTTAIMIAMTEKNTENTDFNIHIFIQLYTYFKNSNNDNDYKSKKKMRLTTYGHDKSKNHNDIYHNLLCNYQQ